MDNPQPDDTELMQATAQGDKNAFDLLIQRHQDGVFAFLRHMGMDRQTAEDITQESFIKIFRSAHHYQPTAQFNTYLFKVVRNCRIDYLRKKSREVDTVELADLAATHAAERQQTGIELELEELREVLNEELELLPEKIRETLLLSQTEGISYQEISEIQEIPKGTVKSRVFSALTTLRQRLVKRNVL